MPSRLTPLKAKYQYLRNHSAFRAAPVVTTMRLVSWWGHCALGLPGSVKLKRYDARLDLPRLWRGVAKLLYAFREKYEPELGHVAATLSPGMTMVDVGASYGVYTAEAMETYYIRNWSIWLDLHILARTIRTVLLGKGAY